MSVDHKPDDPEELKRIKMAGGQVMDGRVNGNLNLSRALGDHEYKQNGKIKQQDQMISPKPDIKKKSIKDVELIVMGCDGIWERKTNQEIGEILYSSVVQHGREISKEAEDMLDNLIAPNTEDENGLDNMTLLVIRVKK